jgi:hypothetical protein
MRELTGGVIEDYHKYIVHTKSSGERYIAGTSEELQHPVSLIDTATIKKAIKGLIQRR